MSTPEDAVLAYWREHRDQLRQSENQRAVLTNFVLVITAAISGFIVQQHPGQRQSCKEACVIDAQVGSSTADIELALPQPAQVVDI